MVHVYEEGEESDRTSANCVNCGSSTRHPLHVQIPLYCCKAAIARSLRGKIIYREIFCAVQCSAHISPERQTSRDKADKEPSCATTECARP